MSSDSQDFEIGFQKTLSGWSRQYPTGVGQDSIPTLWNLNSFSSVSRYRKMFLKQAKATRPSSSRTETVFAKNQFGLGGRTYDSILFRNYLIETLQINLSKAVKYNSNIHIQF